MRPIRPSLRPSVLALALAGAFAPGAAQTLPTLPSVVRGQASFSNPAANQLNVLQSTRSAIINWQSFSIAPGAGVTFRQPDAQSVALNRVTGSTPSSIFGSLTANGRVFVVNPNGVLFGAGASVNVGGLVASTLGISDDDFAAGRYVFSRGGAAPAGVANQATLSAAPGGVIALVGSTATNTGTLQAPGGTAALAAGRTVTLDFQGDGLTQLRITEADAQALAANSGTIVADGGRVMLLADATQATGLVVNQGGLVRARSLASGAGGVIIAGGSGDVGVSGTVDASAGPDANGGSVAVSGRVVTVDRGATLSVDAADHGDGGRIDVTATHAVLPGSFHARGGAQSGDGGLVKVTVSDGVESAGLRVDASAPHGRAGTLDLDPGDVFIYDGATGNDIDTATIDAALDAGTNFTVTATADSGGNGGSIFFGGGFRQANITRSTGSAPVTFRLDARVAIGTNPDTTTHPTSIRTLAGPLDVDFDVDAEGPQGGGITLQDFTLLTGGGSVRLFGQGDPAIAASGISLDNVRIDTRIGQSDANAGGSLTMLGTVDGSPSAGAAVAIVGSTLATSTGALVATGTLGRSAGAGPACRCRARRSARRPAR